MNGTEHWIGDKQMIRTRKIMGTDEIARKLGKSENEKKEIKTLEETELKVCVVYEKGKRKHRCNIL